MLTLVVADDDPEIRRLLARWAGLLGLDCVTVESAGALLRAVGSEPPQALICDVHLAEADGIGLCRILAARHPGLAIIMMTGDAGEVGRARAAGFGHVFEKPFDLRLLEGALRKLVCREGN
ncbi:MAG: response regulator [Elusimicrobia bacterium]|nr:response regulator [Elusimicrobiota bacterium]